VSNPHQGSSFRSAFTDEEWKDIQAIVAERLKDSWYVYIIKSTVTGKLYTGVSNNVAARLKAHNEGKGAKYTRAGRPWKLVFSLPRVGKSAALKAEVAIKKLTRAQKLLLIEMGSLQIG